MNDVAFHFVFGRESRKYNLLNLLNAILAKTEQTPIQDLTLEEIELKAETLGLKRCRLDIRALTSHNHHINIEVQLLNQGNMEKRSLYYWSKLYTEQLSEGQDYSELHKTIAINILDFPYLTNDKVHSIYRVLETETLTELSDMLEMHFLELPRLNERPYDLDCPLTRWLLFLSDQTSQELKEAILVRDENIRHAYEDLEKLAADKNARRQYELREKAALDYRSSMYTARKEGREEGREEGAHLERIRLVKKLLVQGFDENSIKEVAEITQAELDEIKRT